MGSISFWRCCDDSSDRGQAKQQREKSVAGCASKVVRSGKESRKPGVRPTESGLEAVPVSQKESGKGKGGKERRIRNCHPVDAESQTYLFALDVVKGALAKRNWKRDDVFHYNGLGEYLDAESFDVILVRGCIFCINAERVIWLTAHGVYNQRGCSLGPLRRLKLKNLMDLPFARDPRELKYARRLDKIQ